MKEHILLTRGTCGVHTGSRPCFTHMLGTAGHNTAQYHELNNGITSAVVPPLKNCGEGKSLSSEEKFGPLRGPVHAGQTVPHRFGSEMVVMIDITVLKNTDQECHHAELK